MSYTEHRRVTFLPVLKWCGLHWLKRSETYPQVAGAGEILSVLVEGDGHDAVCGVESLLHAVAVMDVNVDVEDPLVVPGKTGVFQLLTSRTRETETSERLLGKYQNLRGFNTHFSNSRMARTMSLT